MPPKAKAKAAGSAGVQAKAAGRLAAGSAAAKAAARPAAARAAAAAPAPGARAGTKRAASSEVVGSPAAKRGRGDGGKKLDSKCPNQSLKVVEDYTVALQQTNVGANNNKFYRIQVLEGEGKYYRWTHWGRTGEPKTKFALEPAADLAKAIQMFKSKFREKTVNDWENKGSFVKKPGKYMLVEIDESGGGDDQAPMGKLTQAQIEKGQAVLAKLTGALTRKQAALAPRKQAAQVTQLSSDFYSLIPTSFGWKKPVPIDTMDLLHEKEELLKFFLRMGFEKVESGAGVTPIDGLMALPLPRSLDEAASGICGKASVASSNKQGAALAAKQAGGPRTTMDASLYAAIMLYTSNAIYADLNKCLRDKDRGKVKKYFKYLRLLFEALQTLPQKKKTLWRGISADLSSDPQYAPGKEVIWWGVSSCTSDQNVAKGFAKGCGAGCTVITVNSTSACDISEISFFGNEKESLLKRGTKFKVVKRSKSGTVTELTLQEIGCSVG